MIRCSLITRISAPIKKPMGSVESRRYQEVSLLLEDPNDFAIAVHDVDAVGSLPESHAILSATRYDGVSQHLEPSLRVGPTVVVRTAFAFEPLVPLSQTL